MTTQAKSKSAVGQDTPTADAPGDTPAKDGESGLLARLSRWLERDQLPRGAEVRALYRAKLTDVAANKLAGQWGLRYQKAEGPERCSLLACLVQAGVGLEPRGDQGLRLFRRLYAQTDSLQLLVELRSDMLRWRQPIGRASCGERGGEYVKIVVVAVSV